MNSGIYEIRNNINGKVYIGSSINTKARWKTHLNSLRRNKHSNRHLQHAWNMYSENNFIFRVLLGCLPKDLLTLEQGMIDANNPEYNICRTAGNMLGYKHTEESKRKIGGNKHTEETKRKMRGNKNALGRKQTEEHNRRVSESSSRPYPAFQNLETGEIIPAGKNLSALCRERGLSRNIKGGMRGVIQGKQRFHKGWALLEGAIASGPARNTGDLLIWRSG